MKLRNQVIKKQNDLEFLVNDIEMTSSSDSEYGDEVYNKLFRKNEEFVEDMQNHTVIKFLKDTG